MLPRALWGSSASSNRISIIGGADKARQDAVDADVRRIFQRDAFGQHDYAGLGRAVADPFRNWVNAEIGSQPLQWWSPSAFQLWDSRFAHVEHTAEVDAELFHKHIVGCFPGTDKGDACAADQLVHLKPNALTASETTCSASSGLVRSAWT